MSLFRWVLTGLLVLILAGCSNKQVYEGLKQSNRNDCLQLPPNQQQACLDKVNQSYEAYQREREALKQEP